MSGLTDAERDIMLAPCACGHTINDHGSLIACWRCEDGGGSCASDFETLLSGRVDVLVRGRLALEGAQASQNRDLTASEPESGQGDHRDDEGRSGARDGSGDV